MSQASIETTTFLEGCISKTRRFPDIYDALGISQETLDIRKEPIFPTSDTNEIHQRIKDHAERFKARYRDDRATMLADLVKDGTFDSEVQELGERYGEALWGADDWRKVYNYGSQSAEWDELKWDREGDRKT